MGMTLAAAAALASCAKKKSADDQAPSPDPKATEAKPPADPVEPPVPDVEASIAGAAMTLGSGHYRLGAPLRSPRFDGEQRLIGLHGDDLVAIDATTGAITSIGAVEGAGSLAALPGGGFVVGANELSVVDGNGGATRELAIDAGRITAIGVSSDGKVLALSGHQGAILVVDAATGKELERLPAGDEGYEAVAFAGSDARLVALRGESVVVLERAGGKELAKIPAPQGVWALANGQLATVAGGTPIKGYDIEVRSAETGAVVVNIHRERAVHALAWTPDGASLLIGDEAGTIAKFELAGRAATPKGEATLHGGAIHALAVSPSGARIAAITDTGAIRFLDAAAVTARDPGPGHLGAVERLAFSGDFLISGGNDSTIWTWELTGSRRQAKIDLAGDLMAMTPAPDDEGVYAQVDVYTRPAGESYTSLSRHLIEGYTLSGSRKFSQELEHGADSLKYCGYRKAIQAVTGSRWKEIDPTSFDVSERGRSTGRSGRLGPNGRFAAFEGHGALIVVDDEGTHRLGTARCSLVNGVAFDQGGEVVAMTDGTGAMRLWRIDGTLVGGVSVAGASSAQDGVVLPDHTTALFTVSDGLLIWDQAKGTVGKIPLPRPSSLAVTPAGDRLAVGFRDGQIGIFDLATLRATAKPLETSPAPELTDDDCHQLDPETYANSLMGGSSSDRRFGDPPTDPGDMGRSPNP